MRTIPYSRFNQELSVGRADKSRVYFNPDNSVVVMDPSEDDIFQWIKERGVSLKEAQFFLNEESAHKIREHLASAKVLEPIVEAQIEEATPVIVKSAPDCLIPSNFNNKETKVKESLAEDQRQLAKKAILKKLKTKQTVASLTEVVNELARLI